MTTEPGTIGLGAFQERHWSVAHEALAAGDEAGILAPDDLERFAIAAQLLGNDDESTDLLVRAHQAHLAGGEHCPAARCAFWLSMLLMERGEMAQAGGWLARAERILDEAGAECVERGYVQVPQGIQLIDQDPEAALRVFDSIAASARRFSDTDLATMGRLGQGQALIRLGRHDEGARRLDEVMTGVVSGEVSPFVSGIMYCAVIELCHEMFDLRRAMEWTTALTRWCESQPDLVMFRGRCLVYRAEVMQLHGEWAAAVREVELASGMLEGQPAVGAAHYRQGELQRLRGKIAEAEESFRRAEEHGRRPEPGRALLRLSQGRLEPAATAIRHALNEAEAPAQRVGLLPAAVDIFLAAGEIESARDAADEEVRLARLLGMPYLDAAAERAQGSVALAAGEPLVAAERLRRSLSGFQALELPYETARTREMLADAAESLGDDETARIHRDAARETYAALGAAPDLARLGGAASEDSGELTPREREVLRLIATGMTNRAIADTLVISEKTAANHVSNILAKLGLSSRAAATAYAYEHGLV